jgi:hypothetical protein
MISLKFMFQLQKCRVEMKCACVLNCLVMRFFNPTLVHELQIRALDKTRKLVKV